MKTVITLKKKLPFCRSGIVGKEEEEQYIFNETGRIRNDYRYTIDEIKDLPDFFDIKTVYEPENLQVGQYREDSLGIYRVMPSRKNKMFTIRYVDGRSSFQSLVDFLPENLCEDKLLATPEIEAALIKEAERRGYKEGQTVNRTWPEPNCCVGKEVVLAIDTCPKYRYGKKEDALYMCGRIIYEGGNWAEIIEEKKEEPKGFNPVTYIEEIQGLVTERINNSLDCQNKLGAIKLKLENLKGYLQTLNKEQK